MIGFVLLALILLVLLFDPNMFKPRIEALAREQGVALNINGDLGWTLWPSLGIDVSDVRVAALSAPDKPIAQLEEASLLLAIKPLFSGDVVVHHVLVDGAVNPRHAAGPHALFEPVPAIQSAGHRGTLLHDCHCCLPRATHPGHDRSHVIRSRVRAVPS